MNDERCEHGITHALEEHQEIRQSNKDLLDYLDRPRPEVSASESWEWAVSLQEKLTTLHARVSRHFRAEEGEVLGKLRDKHPHAAGSLDALLAEHGEMLKELRSLIDAAMTYAEARQPADPCLRARTRRLLVAMSEHEAKEVNLIQELMFTDIGTGE